MLLLQLTTGLKYILLVVTSVFVVVVLLFQ
jgi:hypothetical protein